MIVTSQRCVSLFTLGLIALGTCAAEGADVRWRRPDVPSAVASTDTGRVSLIRPVQFDVPSATSLPPLPSLTAIPDIASPLTSTILTEPLVIIPEADLKGDTVGIPATDTTPAPMPTMPTTVPAPVPSLTRFPTAVIPKRDVTLPCPDPIGFRPIRDISYNISPDAANGLPRECAMPQSTYQGRDWSPQCFHWKASALATKGAYFEDVKLERYGHSLCPIAEPLISGAKFFASVPLLPYKAGLRLPNECVYTLGHYRVGDCAPYMLDPLPLSVRAGLFQASATVGAAAMFP